MINHLGQQLMIKASDARLLAYAWVSLYLIELALRRRGFHDVVQRIETSVTPSQDTVTSRNMRRAQRYARRIEIAARYHLVCPRCLHRSLVLHQWLRGEGLPSQLQIGVVKSGNELKAHAWVTIDGYVVNDRPESIRAFTPLAPAWRADRSCGEARFDTQGPRWQ